MMAAGRSRLPVLGLFLLASTDQDADFSNGCGDWKCFHPWLPLLVDIRGTLDGLAAALNPKCFQTGAMVFRLAAIVRFRAWFHRCWH